MEYYSKKAISEVFFSMLILRPLLLGKKETFFKNNAIPRKGFLEKRALIELHFRFPPVQHY
jgi:hypothetical protein